MNLSINHTRLAPPAALPVSALLVSALLLTASPAFAADKADGDGILYIIAVPFALVALGVLLHLGRSLWMLSHPAKKPVHH